MVSYILPHGAERVVSQTNKERTVSLMGEVSREQALEVMAKAGTNCDWRMVTSRQAQEAIKDPIHFGREFAMFLQNGGQAMTVTIDGIVPPQGGRIHVMSVSVDESRRWEDAVKAVAGDINPGGYIWLVGDEYPSVSTTESNVRVIFLVNFGERVISEDVLVWSKGKSLHPVTPRTVFAVGEYRPNLNGVIGMGRISVVSLKCCFFEGKSCICGVRWSGQRRDIFLQEFACAWSKNNWFAFVRE